jgi:hypothetical protein
MEIREGRELKLGKLKAEIEESREGVETRGQRNDRRFMYSERIRNLLVARAVAFSYFIISAFPFQPFFK